eukprot:8982789-Ditylum_brightwellii.AAC.1
MNVISKAFCKQMRHSIPNHQALFSLPFLEVQGMMSHSISALNYFSSMLNRLTDVDLRGLKANPWVGPPYTSSHAMQLSARIDKVLCIRATHEEMLCVLSTARRSNLAALNIFE